MGHPAVVDEQTNKSQRLRMTILWESERRPLCGSWGAVQIPAATRMTIVRKKVWNVGPFGRWIPLNRVKASRVRRPSKGDTVMKRITAIALLAIANLAVAGTSFAQSKTVQAKVPFDFTVGNKLLPSGTYTIK